MGNLIKKELDMYFKSLFAYFFGAVLLMFSGVYIYILNCSMGYAGFEYTLNNMSFMYLILIPILTMRSVAEERKQRTDQLLYSLPVSMTDVVLSKYIAMLITLGLPLLVICFYPPVLLRFGDISLKSAYITMAAFYLLGAALTAIGLFASTLTENQAIAAGISFVVFLFAYFGSGLTERIPGTASASLIALIVLCFVAALVFFIFTRQALTAAELFICAVCILAMTYRFHRRVFEGLFANIVGSLSLFERFYVFVRGVLDLRSVVYYISVIVLFLFLSVQSLEKRRWS